MCLSAESETRIQQEDNSMRLQKRRVLYGLGIAALTVLRIHAEEPVNRSIKCRRGSNTGNRTIPDDGGMTR